MCIRKSNETKSISRILFPEASSGSYHLSCFVVTNKIYQPTHVIVFLVENASEPLLDDAYLVFQPVRFALPSASLRRR